MDPFKVPIVDETQRGNVNELNEKMRFKEYMVVCEEVISLSPDNGNFHDTEDIRGIYGNLHQFFEAVKAKEVLPSQIMKTCIFGHNETGEGREVYLAMPVLGQGVSGWVTFLRGLDGFLNINYTEGLQVSGEENSESLGQLNRILRTLEESRYFKGAVFGTKYTKVGKEGLTHTANVISTGSFVQGVLQASFGNIDFRNKVQRSNVDPETQNLRGGMRIMIEEIKNLYQ